MTTNDAKKAIDSQRIPVHALKSHLMLMRLTSGSVVVASIQTLIVPHTATGPAEGIVISVNHLAVI